MTNHSGDEFAELLEAWRANEATAVELFAGLRDPMRRAARRGIRRILVQRPDETDVDDVVLKAFKTELEQRPGDVKRSLEGFACTVAYRRGMDQARSIIREREQIKRQAWQLAQLAVTAEDEDGAAERELLLRHALDCMGMLTPDQRDVIEATVQRQESLSDWVSARGTTYEAGRRMRGRGLAALRRCIDTKRDTEREEGS